MREKSNKGPLTPGALCEEDGKRTGGRRAGVITYPFRGPSVATMEGPPPAPGRPAGRNDKGKLQLLL